MLPTPAPLISTVPVFDATLPAASATTSRTVCCPFGSADASTVIVPAPSEAPALPSERHVPPWRHCRVATATPACASAAVHAAVIGRAPPGENTAREIVGASTSTRRRARTSVKSDGNGPPLRTVTRIRCRPEVSPASETGTTRRPGGVAVALRRTQAPDSPPSDCGVDVDLRGSEAEDGLQGVGRGEIQVEAARSSRSARRAAGCRVACASTTTGWGLGVTAVLPAASVVTTRQAWTPSAIAGERRHGTDGPGPPEPPTSRHSPVVPPSAAVFTCACEAATPLVASVARQASVTTPGAAGLPWSSDACGAVRSTLIVPVAEPAPVPSPVGDDLHGALTVRDAARGRGRGRGSRRPARRVHRTWPPTTIRCHADPVAAEVVVHGPVHPQWAGRSDPTLRDAAERDRGRA